MFAVFHSYFGLSSLDIAPLLRCLSSLVSSGHVVSTLMWPMDDENTYRPTATHAGHTRSSPYAYTDPDLLARVEILEIRIEACERGVSNQRERLDTWDCWYDGWRPFWNWLWKLFKGRVFQE